MEYEFLVRTGGKENAGTNSEVQVQLFGQKGQTEAMKLDNPGINDFKRYAYDHFTVAGAEVGDLKNIRVWHDNSGKQPGWYLKNIWVMRPEGGAWEATCNKWLARSKGDGKIDRTFSLKKSSSTQYPGLSNADRWDTPEAYKVAEDLVGGYCGPNVVVWVAKIWNDGVGRPYNASKRLRDKKLFPDGPRMFDTNAAGFQDSLNDILKRETKNDLHLSSDTYYKYSTIHDRLEQYDMPIIIRMGSGIALHYVTLYKSRKRARKNAFDKIKFYWQDNGTYGRKDGGNPGLHETEWKDVGEYRFPWGAKRVVGG